MISLAWEYLKELNDFKRGEMHLPGKPSLLLFTIGFLGIAMVVAGVSGELYIDVRSESIETGIRKANEDLLSLISTEASNAETSAQGAADAASRAKSEADEVASKLPIYSLNTKRPSGIYSNCEPKLRRGGFLHFRENYFVVRFRRLRQRISLSVALTQETMVVILRKISLRHLAAHN